MTRPDLRTAHARRTRAAIRAAALCLTRERGYVAMTVDDVAALAGVSRRTVFNHFSSKADLIVVGLDPPDPDDVEAFVSGTGALLEDLGSLLAAHDDDGDSTGVARVLAHDRLLALDDHHTVLHHVDDPPAPHDLARRNRVWTWLISDRADLLARQKMHVVSHSFSSGRDE